MKVLVTGAAGFIGARLCKKLHGQGAEIAALALPGENTDIIRDHISRTIEGDITRPKAWPV